MHLSDTFLELFTFIRYVTDPSQVVDADYATVRDDVSRLIRRMEDRAADRGVPPERFDMARFAVFAWVDEAVLCSSWPGARQWLKSPLQREYYGTVNAGEEFFERLDGLLGNKMAERDKHLLPEFAEEVEQEVPNKVSMDQVLEVYTQCLALGFTGMYFHEGDSSRLDKLRRDCIDRIVGRQGGNGLSAFPDAYGSGAAVPEKSRYGRVFDPLSILFFLLPLLVVAGIFFAYRGLLRYSLSLWFG